MEEALATFVDVVLPLSLPRLYTYRVQQDWAHEVKVGARVIVQFGSIRIYSAIVQRIHNQAPLNYTAKYIHQILDESPLLNEKQIQLWEWMANYYLCSLGDIMDAALPAPFKLASESRVYADPSFIREQAELDDKEYMILEALDLQPQLSISEISKVINLKNVFPVIRSLMVKGAILMKEEVSEKYKEKTIKVIDLAGDYTSETALKELFDLYLSKDKHTRLLMALLMLKQDLGDVPKKTLIEKADVSEAILKHFITKGIFVQHNKAIDRIAGHEIVNADYELTPAQSLALSQIEQSFEQKDVCLLYGPNASGKTYLYSELIRKNILEGKQVLVLLPELAIASQIADRLRKLSGATCLSYHSKFSGNEKVEIWNKVANHEVQLVIGARSALFLPFDNLGLIIVDEEHESSFKQFEPAPRFHARDTAIVLASLYKAKILLGSATPSFESYFNSKNGKYALVRLSERFHQIAAPQIDVIDVSSALKMGKMNGNFSKELIENINENLIQHKQIILFHNRRGYSQMLECNACDWVMKCRNCDISLSYHRNNNSMQCHYCNQVYAIPPICPACGLPDIRFKGSGTEKMEEEVQLLFPEARIGRLDLDAMKTKFGVEQIIKDVETQNTDILIGTQMVVKGLDFDHVGLTAALLADQLLYFPDFRAYERAYQILSQVSGRSGRRLQQGKSIIQVSKPAHVVIQAVQSGEFEMLYQNEMKERAKFGYPPFSRLIKVSLKHNDMNTVEEAAIVFVRMLDETFGNTMLGPAVPFVSRIRNKFIRDVLFKLDKQPYHLNFYKKKIQEAIEKIYSDKRYKNIQIVVDVDPI